MALEGYLSPAEGRILSEFTASILSKNTTPISTAMSNFPSLQPAITVLVDPHTHHLPDAPLFSILIVSRSPSATSLQSVRHLYWQKDLQPPTNSSPRFRLQRHPASHCRILHTQFYPPFLTAPGNGRRHRQVRARLHASHRRRLGRPRRRLHPRRSQWETYAAECACRCQVRYRGSPRMGVTDAAQRQERWLGVSLLQRRGGYHA